MLKIHKMIIWYIYTLYSAHTHNYHYCAWVKNTENLVSWAGGIAQVVEFMPS
jgi:hypothetical protein